MSLVAYADVLAISLPSTAQGLRVYDLEAGMHAANCQFIGCIYSFDINMTLT